MNDRESAASTRLAVQVTDGYFSYGFRKSGTTVLNRINLNVTQGIIYGLLGPSGCGKTTLLNAVVGLHKLKQGSVKVFGEAPRSANSIVPGRGVGYMPQDFCLFERLTIQETLWYFGSLQGLDKTTLDERCQFLIQFLDLPRNDKLVINLSSGQQRRVSLAVALVHTPPLLILDEPTVGVDPLLRHCIWDYLAELSARGNTVIVTSHYIEEMLQSNMVGLMREGKLLAETSPSRLMSHYGVSDLETAFLRLCQSNQVEDFGSNDHVTGATCYQNPIHPITEKQTIGARELYLQKLRALLFKDGTQMKRSPATLIMQFLFPAFIVIFMSFSIGSNMKHIQLAVVNQERPVVNSQTFLNFIDSDIIAQKPMQSLEEAVESVKLGVNYGVIHIQSNFSRALSTKIKDGWDATDDAILKSCVLVQMDLTNTILAFEVGLALLQAFQTFHRHVLQMEGLNALLAQSPIQFENPIFGSESFELSAFTTPGCIISVLFFFAMALTAQVCVAERRTGLYYRSWLSGVTPTQAILSYMLTNSIILSAQVTGCLVFLFTFLQLWPSGALIWMVVLCLLQGVVGMAMGMVVSVVADTELLSLLLSIVIYIPTGMFSGFLWPVEAQPHIIRYYVAPFMPQTIPSDALRALLYKGYGIGDTLVWLAIVVETSWILATIVIAIVVLRLKT